MQNYSISQIVRKEKNWKRERDPDRNETGQITDWIETKRASAEEWKRQTRRRRRERRRRRRGGKVCF